MSTLSPSSRRGGFSLIEVAIALAIFVFGALAIVQIFPPALGVIRNNESRTTATQLGETLLARSAGKPASVPDAIYESDATGAWLSTSDLPIAVVGTVSKNNSLPRSPLPGDFNSSALNSYKYISGERHVVRGGGAVQYVLLNFPASATNVQIDLEEEIKGVQISSEGKLDFTYASDSSGNPFTSTTASMVGNPPDDKGTDDGVTYYVSYRWYAPGGRINGVLREPLLLPNTIWAGAEGKVLRTVFSSLNRTLPGSIEVHYKQRLGSVVPSTGNSIRGYVNLSSFVPPAPRPSVVTGKTYSFSYLVSDWRWIMDDNNSPSPTGVVQLPIQNIDREAYTGIDSVIGLRTIVGSAALPIQETPAATMTQTSYKTGTVPYTAGSGFRYRTVYRGLDGWAQQPSIAAKSYVPNLIFNVAARPSTVPQEQWREYFWANSAPGQLYFHPSEAGKSVVVSFEDITGNVIKNAVLTIKDNLIAAPASIPTGPLGYAVNGFVVDADFTDHSGNRVDAAAILSVQGLSVQARTAWQNGDRYNQVIVPGYRNLMQ